MAPLGRASNSWARQSDSAEDMVGKRAETVGKSRNLGVYSLVIRKGI